MKNGLQKKINEIMKTMQRSYANVNDDMHAKAIG